jgi:hypothetical protein
MTSANVTNYTIKKDGEVVGEHSQHHMCHPNWHRLYKFVPFTQHTIQSHWLDEEEEYHEGKEMGLSEFIANHKPSISDMRRMTDHIEKQNVILKEWVEKFGDQDKKLTLTTLNSISYSPL